MMCNQNKNSTLIIYGSEGFDRCAQTLLAKKLVELRPSKNCGSNEQWGLGGLWKPVSYWYVLKNYFDSKGIQSTIRRGGISCHELYYYSNENLLVAA